MLKDTEFITKRVRIRVLLCFNHQIYKCLTVLHYSKSSCYKKCGKTKKHKSYNVKSLSKVFF